MPSQPNSDSDHLFAKLAGVRKPEAKPPAGCGCPVASTDEPTDTAAGCPVASSSQTSLDPTNMMPKVPNQAISGQATNLSVRRQHSSIPTTASQLPKHQENGSTVWVYPSEQMFYNAMKRKGWDAKEDDMPVIVAIHNAVNERAWKEVLAFESLHSHSCPLPRLKRFMGRPNDYSPKARLLNFLGFKLPFDRHDWIVDRCGKDVRYVIDFYSSAPRDPSKPVGVYLDVRPALDTPGALLDRLRMQWLWIMSGNWQTA